LDHGELFIATEMRTPFPRSEMCKPTDVAVFCTCKLQAAVAYIMIAKLVVAGRTRELISGVVVVNRLRSDLSSIEFTS